MKRIFLYILVIFIIIIAIVLVHISDKNTQRNEISKFNVQFEQYVGKDIIYGTDVLTIINKAIDSNEKNKIARDENNYYIEDDSLSVKVDIILLSKNDKGDIEEKTFPMEQLEKAGLDGFVTNFNLTPFEFSSIEYNSQKRVSKIIVKQLEL